jgi:hypothetical protein
MSDAGTSQMLGRSLHKRLWKKEAPLFSPKREVEGKDQPLCEKIALPKMQTSLFLLNPSLVGRRSR